MGSLKRCRSGSAQIMGAMRRDVIKLESLLGADADTTDDALDEVIFWKKPSRVKVKPSSHNPKYKEIVQFDYTQVEKKHEAKTQGGYADLSDLEDIPF